MPWPVRAVANLSRNDVTAAIPLKFYPHKPRSVDSHDDDSRHCQFGVNAKDRGARAKLVFVLLRRAQAMAWALWCGKNTPASDFKEVVKITFRYSNVILLQPLMPPSLFSEHIYGKRYNTCAFS